MTEIDYIFTIKDIDVFNNKVNQSHKIFFYYYNNKPCLRNPLGQVNIFFFESIELYQNAIEYILNNCSNVFISEIYNENTDINYVIDNIYNKENKFIIKDITTFLRILIHFKYYDNDLFQYCRLCNERFMFDDYDMYYEKSFDIYKTDIELLRYNPKICQNCYDNLIDETEKIKYILPDEDIEKVIFINYTALFDVTFQQNFRENTDFLKRQNDIIEFRYKIKNIK